MKLFDFQKQGLKDTERFSRCAYFWEMGTGKTFVGSEKLWSFQNRINLIVCQKSKIEDWFDHMINLYGSKGAIVYDLSYKKHYDQFLIDSRKPDTGQKLIGIINYDLIYRRVDLKHLSGIALMLDESQYIANDTTKRTKFILSMNVANVVLLSGTPVSGKYEQLYSQLRLLGWRISKKEFWNRYVIYRLWKPMEWLPPIKLVVGYQNVEDLKGNLRRFGATFLKSEEAIDLPDQRFNTVYVQPNMAYKTFRKNNIVTVDNTLLVGDTVLKMLLYSRQLCGAFNKEKISAFMDLIDSTSSRVVVFYNFTNELKALIKAIGERPYSVVNGETRDLTTYEECEDSIIFVQYQAGAEGLNLQKANHLIYFTPPLSSAKFEQSKKRIHRLGQTKKCFYYQLVCEGSVEEKIYENLKEGKDYTEKLFEKGNEL